MKSHQSSDYVQGQVKSHPQCQRHPIALVDVCSQVSNHDLLNYEEVRGAHAAAIDPDDVRVIEASHDLELMLRR